MVSDKVLVGYSEDSRIFSEWDRSRERVVSTGMI